MARIIQRGMYPSIGICSEVKMFFRLNSQATVDFNQKTLHLCTGGMATTCTYFNSISVCKYRSNIKHLLLHIQYKGTLKITFKLSRLGYSDQVLLEQILANKDWTLSDIELPFWPELQNGLLFFEIYALDTSAIRQFVYLSNTEAITPVYLGIIITHYNRKNYILPAIEYLKSALLLDATFGSKVEIVIVDNSQNLPEINNVTIIKNPNLGGAGGFTRGLMYLKTNPKFTHGLFMDDDASCEAESIARTITLLESTQDHKIAVAGAMLTEKEVYRQHESGAYFDGAVHSVDKGLNVLYIRHLLRNERDKRVDYGAWWFFAFNLKGIEYNAFPYFVRGDDISFSYANKLKVITMNGICSWQPDFRNKSSPISVYFDVRNHLMHPLHGLIKRNALWSMLKGAVVIYACYAVNYFYDSAQATNIAITDVLTGPDFWRNNVNMLDKRHQINELMTTEKPVPVPHDVYSKGVMAKVEEHTVTDITDKTKRFGLAALIRFLTLNGHLLPTVLFHPGFVWIKKSSGNRITSLFRYKKAVMLIDESDQCLILTHNKKRFFRQSFRFIYLLSRLIWNYKKLRNIYTQTYAELTSDEFWQTEFDKEVMQHK